MHRQRRMQDAVHFYMSEFNARVVAESGIPSDRHHLGKLILQGLRDAPEHILQIDAGTGESETNASVLRRSVRCANAMRALSVGIGDVMILMAPAHLHVAIAYYAALYLGVIVAPIDRTFKLKELQETFANDLPKIIFCQSDKTADVATAVKNLNIDSYIVTFDEVESKMENVMTFDELLKKTQYADVDKFRATDFNPDNTTAFLIATSGTTGLPKQAVATHASVATCGPYMWSRFYDFPTPSRMTMIVSQLQWVTAQLNFNLSPIMKYTRLQSSLPITQEHAYEMINKYRPTFMIISPPFLTTLVREEDRHKCDFTCFEEIYTGGSLVSKELIAQMKAASPNTLTCNGFGCSEMSMFVFSPVVEPFGSAGVRYGNVQYRLVDADTEKDIVEPNVTGELWVTGLNLVKGYYRNPEATKAAFRSDGWYRTGDLFYRDEAYNFFFVEKLKLLLKYKNHQVSPAEVESVIHELPGVENVVVTGIPEPECGELITACVVRKAGYNVTAQDIKDIVSKNLTDTKHLRGGVVFFEEFPLTQVGKINRPLLKKMVLESERE